MLILVKALVAFAIAATVAWLELVTTRYPRTIGLFWDRGGLWTYAVVYGLISAGFTLGYDQLTRAGVLQPVGLAQAGNATPQTANAPGEGVAPSAGSTEPTWLAVVLLGLSAKALLHVRIFSVPTAGTDQAFPVGTETLVLIFEPWLLRTILIQEYRAVQAYLAPKAAAYPTLGTVQAVIIGSIPNTIPAPERAALTADVNKTTSVRDALELGVRAFGPKWLDQYFPIPPSPAGGGS